SDPAQTSKRTSPNTTARTLERVLVSTFARLGLCSKDARARVVRLFKKLTLIKTPHIALTRLDVGTLCAWAVALERNRVGTLARRNACTLKRQPLRQTLSSSWPSLNSSLTRHLYHRISGERLKATARHQTSIYKCD